MSVLDRDAIVVGGGFFGCRLAIHLARAGQRVTLLERGRDLLERASFANQARVHNGYHYPRSLLTALRSRMNFGRFTEEYADCIESSFAKYYAVAREFSNVTAAQFAAFCRRIGAPLAPAPASVRGLFDLDRVEDVFEVTEYAFDAERLRRRMREELRAADVELRLGASARRVESAGGGIAIEIDGAGASVQTATRVFNCTYSQTNRLLEASGLPGIPLKHEFAEIALVEAPESLRGTGVTLMCGPFFSVMPFPARPGLHSFSHVRYTPHCAWQDAGRPDEAPHVRLEGYPKQSRFPHMRKDAERFLPLLSGCRYVESLWETKTVLPLSEGDDSRPILFRRDHGLKGLTCVLGAKIDNIYDVLQEIDSSCLLQTA